MTPAERLVIEAAQSWNDTPRVSPDFPVAEEVMVRAVRALRAEPAPIPLNESERTWGEVVEGDEIYSDKTKRWYPVISVHRQGDRVALRASGLPKVINPEAAKPVRVRRGETGAAADLFTTIMFSGPALNTSATGDEPSEEVEP